ncbi:MAG: RagB/SusD family nutrient uptake outer membrane protein [Chitinophagales bacterium]|nr:RagB/SusD family nutrient uptake outer membrane protein [Chitinophagales bacterium]
MKILSLKTLALLAGMVFILPSCFKDLDTIPLDEDVITSAAVYNDPKAYKQVLAKLYAGLALSGQEGPAGLPDISGIDEGFSTYLRQYWKAQELTTDEAVIAWNDGTIQDYHQQDWDANNEFVTAMYNRIFYQISLCNEYLRETTPDKVAARPGGTESLQGEVKRFRAEARFLRALSYWHALDLYRKPPFVTENDQVGNFFPPQASPQQLFDYIESELNAIEGDLAAPRTNEYARADQAAAWMLLAKLYLNAEVYTGRNLYSECAATCQRVIGAGYSLDPDYSHLFMADNNNAEGIIFPVAFDGTHSKTWGGMTFVAHAAVGGSMSAAEFGLDGGWGGTRTTSAFVGKFPAVGGGSVIVAPNDGNTTYPVIYVPGGYQGWAPATAQQLASPAGDNTYEGYIYFPDDQKEFKFTLGPDWSNNLGDNGSNGTLEPTGSNISVPEGGFYKINVDLTALTYTIQKTNWGLIGDATPGGWGSDQDMTYDAAEKVWTITVGLTGGSVKFRANDDWGLNYGDNGPNALLERDGANIAIPGNGTYTIKLYLDKPDYTYSIERPSFDRRALFYTDGQSLEIGDISIFTDGYAITKFRNVTTAGAPGSNLTFVDIDFPMFRIEDAYLMYAEAVLRGGSGDINTAVTLVNAVRQRAYGDASGDITANELTLDFILDERAREFYWECHRRTDLVRFGRFSESSYVWPWKGGVPEGVSTAKHFNVFPIPASDRGANPNLQQNEGY